MMVMPTNGSYPWLHYWAGRAPGSVGHLYSPGGQRGPYRWLPFALDNGAFTGFCEKSWKALLRWACLCGTAPLWAAVPDAVGDAEKTLSMWATHHQEAERYGWPLAFVVQDGMQPQDVPSKASLIFVGGTTDWKQSTVEMWCNSFRRVHVGRINSGWMLSRCAELGAESCDGTGWARGDKKQLAGLLKFLESHNRSEKC